MSQANIPATAAPQGVIRAKGVAAFLNIGLSTVWKWHAEGKFPPGRRGVICKASNYPSSQPTIL